MTEDSATKRRPMRGRLDMLVITSYYPPPYQGASNRALSLARHLAGRLRGCRFGFLVLDDGRARVGSGDEEWIVERRSWVFRPTPLNPLHLMWAIAACISALRRHSPALALVVAPPANALVAGILACRISAVPVALDLQDDWEGVYRDSFPEAGLSRRVYGAVLMGYSLVAGRLCRDLVLVVAVNQALAARSGRRYGVPVVVVTNGLDPQDLPQRTDRGSRPPRDPTIVLCGNLSWKPGPVAEVGRYLIGCHRAVWEVKAIGPGSERIAGSTLGELNDARVRFLGTLPRRDALLEISRSDVALLAMAEHSQTEHVFPVKLMDYLVCGTPVLAVVPPGSRAASVVEAHGAGVVVPPGDHGRIPSALCELLSPRFAKAGARNRFMLAKALSAPRQWDRLLGKLTRMGIGPGPSCRRAADERAATRQGGP